MDNNVFVFAKITPKPEFYSDTKSALAGMLDATRQEKGCIWFDLHSSECEKHLYLYEEWQDRKYLAAHHEQTHTKAVASKLESWLYEPTEVSLMNKIDAQVAL